MFWLPEKLWIFTYTDWRQFLVESKFICIASIWDRLDSDEVFTDSVKFCRSLWPDPMRLGHCCINCRWSVCYAEKLLNNNWKSGSVRQSSSSGGAWNMHPTEQTMINSPNSSPIQKCKICNSIWGVRLKAWSAGAVHCCFCCACRCEPRAKPQIILSRMAWILFNHDSV